MYSSCLALIQSFCREYALPAPGTIQGQNDAGALQLRELLQATGEYIWERGEWEQCLRRVEFSGTGLRSLGRVNTICSDNFAHIIPETFWNNTVRTQMLGPVSNFNWQARLSLSNGGTSYAFRIAGGVIETSTPVPLTHKLTLIYKSQSWVLDGTSPQQFYTKDTDMSVFSDKLMKAGLRAHWLRVKQMPHALEFARFDEMVTNEAGKASVKAVLATDGTGSSGDPYQDARRAIISGVVGGV